MRLLIPTAFCLMLLLLGCGNDDPSAVGPCPPGHQLDRRGDCVLTGNSGGGRDVGARDVGVEPDLPENCTAGERTCADRRTVAECNDAGDGWLEGECPSGQVCEGGECTESDECEPGEVLGCGSTQDQLICAANGLDTELRPCPASAPNCFDGECSDQLCEPGNRRCDGTNVMECNEDGETESFVQLCEFGCESGRCVDPCASDGKDYLGCTFWAADLDNIGPDANAAQFAVTISNATLDPVEVEIARGNGDVVRNLTIPTDSLETVFLDRQDVDNSALTSNTYRISSGTPVTVHQFNPLVNEGVFSNDASLLLPSTSVGTEYIVIGWPSITSDADLRAYVAVINPNPEPTDVTVTSPVATLAGDGVPALQAGIPQTFTMEQGQVLSLITNDLNPNGLTGMEIVGTRPIVVFSGHECANIPSDNNFCDHLEQQLLPVDTWGTEFVGAKFSPRGTEPDVWRVVAAESGTTITTSPSIPGVSGATLGRGEYREFVTTSDFVVNATGPIQLAQFMVGSAYPGPSGGCDLVSPFPVTHGCAIPRSCELGTGIGDPAFLINVPTAQFREEYIVLTPAQYQQDFLTMVSPPGTNITLDGRAVTTPPTRVGAWEVRRVSAPDGPHRIEADNDIGLYAYGYDCDVSYAYPGGLNLESL